MVDINQVHMVVEINCVDNVSQGGKICGPSFEQTETHSTLEYFVASDN